MPKFKSFLINGLLIFIFSWALVFVVMKTLFASFVFVPIPGIFLIPVNINASTTTLLTCILLMLGSYIMAGILELRGLGIFSQSQKEIESIG
ncbi:MAG: hypothetical protein ACI9TY_001018 [Alphaproteobacteria bacterium]|jgi:hypothetical protein